MGSANNSGRTVKTVTDTNRSLMDFAQSILVFHGFQTNAIETRRKLAIWLRDNRALAMYDPHAPLPSSMFRVDERIQIPSKEEVSKIIAIGVYRTVGREYVFFSTPRLSNESWLDADGNAIPNMLSERTPITLSVDYAVRQARINFTIFRRRHFSLFGRRIITPWEIIGRALGVDQAVTSTYIAEWHYMHRHRKDTRVEVYFRAHRDGISEGESNPSRFIDRRILLHEFDSVDIMLAKLENNQHKTIFVNVPYSPNRRLFDPLDVDLVERTLLTLEEDMDSTVLHPGNEIDLSAALNAIRAINESREPGANRIQSIVFTGGHGNRSGTLGLISFNFLRVEPSSLSGIHVFFPDCQLGQARGMLEIRLGGGVIIHAFERDSIEFSAARFIQNAARNQNSPPEVLIGFFNRILTRSPRKT